MKHDNLKRKEFRYGLNWVLIGSVHKTVSSTAPYPDEKTCSLRRDGLLILFRLNSDLDTFIESCNKGIFFFQGMYCISPPSFVISHGSR